MPITLSDGRYLEDTKQVDRRGYPIMIDTNGNLYTVQNGKVVLSRKSETYDPQEASGVLASLAKSGNTDLIAPYKTLKQQFKDSLPDPSVFELPEFSDFEKQAGEEVGKFFIKDFDQLDKEFKTLRKQAEQKTALAAKQELESYSAFRGVEDRQFADALQTVQNGFAGRGTSTSGVRYKALADQDAAREDVLAEKARTLEQSGATRELGFSHLLENYDIQQETQRLALERQQEQARLQRASQLQQEEILRRQSLAGIADENAGRYLNSGLAA